MAGHERFRYDVSREDIKAEGLADFSTECRLVARIAASSFTRCGLLPVFSSCCIAPITISSLMPSVSTLFAPSLPGDGGGDNSTARFGFSSLILMVVVLGGLIMPEGGDSEPCDRFGFFTGGSSPSTIVLGGEGCDTARERLGTMMPSSESDSDFLLVLYGMVGNVVMGCYNIRSMSWRCKIVS